ncbi:conserved hypothetical protein, partial [Trichinella spiralis]|uniref:hypothetical protein n=1 Tax=Trichinella spiralis TaxID=6334 RepID=UPI0001EFD872
NGGRSSAEWHYEVNLKYFYTTKKLGVLTFSSQRNPSVSAVKIIPFFSESTIGIFLENCKISLARDLVVFAKMARNVFSKFGIVVMVIV